MGDCQYYDETKHFSKSGFPKIRGTILGVPIIRTIVFWGLYWGPPILGNYQIGTFKDMKDAWVLQSYKEGT